MNKQQAKQITDAIDAIMGTTGTAPSLVDVRDRVQRLMEDIDRIRIQNLQLTKRVLQLETAEPVGPEWMRKELVKQAKEIQDLRSVLGLQGARPE